MSPTPGRVRRVNWRAWRTALRRQLPNRFNAKRMALLCHELSTTYEAGLPIVRSLSLLADGSPSRAMRRSLRRLASDIERGATLADAIHWQGRRFPTFFRELVAGGEVTGTLGPALRHLTAYYEDRVALQRRILTMLTYPFVVFVCAVFVIPLFELYAKSAFGLAPRDAPNEFLLHSVLTWGVNIAILVALVRLGILNAVWSVVGTYLPPFSDITRHFALGRFFRALALFLESGFGAAKSVEHAAAVSGNAFIRRRLLRALPAVRRGEPLSEALAATRYVGAQSLMMLAVGEESGKVDETLAKISHYHIEDGLFRLRTRLLALLILAIMGFMTMAVLSRAF